MTGNLLADPLCAPFPCRFDRTISCHFERPLPCLFERPLPCLFDRSGEISGDGRGEPKGFHTLEFPPQKYRYDVQLMEFADIIRGKCKPTYSYEHDYLVHEVTLAAAGYTKWS